jgi:hypothetical protein
MSLSNADPRIAVSTDKPEGVDEPTQPVLPFSTGSLFRPDTFDIGDTPRPQVSPRIPAEPRYELDVPKTYPVTVGIEVAGDNGAWSGRIIDSTWSRGMRPDDATIAVSVRQRATTSIPMPDRNVIICGDNTELPSEWKQFAATTKVVKVPNLETATVRAALDRFANS